MKHQGKKIILTGAYTEMSDYAGNPLDPFFSGSIPNRAFFFSWFNSIPPVPCDEEGRALVAPYGLRKIEAALLNNGIDEDDLIIIHPKYLKRHLGSNTKIVGITSMDPVGMTYCDRTFTAMIGFGDESRNAYAFRTLVHNKLLHKYHPKIIVGGAGAWQVRGRKMRQYFNIDHVIIGEGEVTVPDVFKKILRGDPVPPVIKAEAPKDDNAIPLINKPAVYGTVEISRGCGRGCKFCTPNRRMRRDFPIDRILEEVKLNICKENKSIFIATEDTLLYGCRNPKFIPNEEAVIELYQSIASVPGVTYIIPAHISLAAVTAAPKLISRITEIFENCIDKIPKKMQRRGLISFNKRRFFGAETGIESGSPRIIEKYMPGKVLPYAPNEWPEVVMQALGILNDSNWTPLASMMVGMPEESEEDTIKSIELLDQFKNNVKIVLIPVLFTPLGDSRLWNKRAANLGACTELQKELFVKAWDYNLSTFSEEWLQQSIAKFGFPFVGGLLYFLYYRWKKHHSFYRDLITKICKIR
ncbi:MAG TPA: radical SAM protein [Candidatus Deferrimicrobium sp.]|nr:radical SAM protein [Candidatus Deferrimicrobium sp.]